MARRIYHVTPESERTEKKRQLAKILSVSVSSVQGWLSRIDKDAKDARDKRIFSKWLACWTQDEIAESEGMSQPAVLAILSEFPELEKLIKSSQTLATYGAPSCTWVKRMWTVRAALCASRRYDGSTGT